MKNYFCITAINPFLEFLSSFKEVSSDVWQWFNFDDELQVFEAGGSPCHDHNFFPSSTDSPLYWSWDSNTLVIN